ncbi:MAG: helicase-related protein [Candidatus Hydrogenedentota bacterium]
MPGRQLTSPLFIVDNADTEWKVQNYLQEWAEESVRFDIATGTFEIGGLLALDGKWQGLDGIRILMGEEVTLRTRQAFEKARNSIERTLDDSLEREKEGNDFLHGVSAIVEALRAGKIQCRVYRKEKFHAKAFITHARKQVIGAAALVGSSNFTLPGLTQNVELNLQLRQGVENLQEWYEHYWDNAEEITPDILKVIERHIREYTPFEVYAKALQQLIRGHELTANEWEKQESLVYSKLDRYQQEGYHALLKIAHQHNGAFLCDGVGLGKTFIGMMLIERLIKFDKKNVLLLVPKSARESVWEPKLKELLPSLFGPRYSNLEVISHTDLSRGETFNDDLENIRERADVIIIDEAHNFRNRGKEGGNGRRPSRYRRLAELAAGKPIYMLTATPINNSLRDLQHQIELFTQGDNSYFQRTCGINSLPGHFLKLEKAIAQRVAGDGQQDDAGPIDVNMAEAEDVLKTDRLFEELVVQRSRSYVRESQKNEDGAPAIFPTREDPKVANYSVKKIYGRLLESLEKAFHKKNPLFALPMYYPLGYYKGDDETIDPKLENRQKQVVGLIRIQFLKRFESSPVAFQQSCASLLGKLIAFVEKNIETEAQKKQLHRWRQIHGETVDWAIEQQMDFTDPEPDDESSDIFTPEMLEAAEELKPGEYKLDEILNETLLDMEQLVQFIAELKRFQPRHDNKLQALIKLLKNDSALSKHKVLIFTEYHATAKYLKHELEKAGFTHIDQVDSTTKRRRADIICQFSPYYNGMTSPDLAAKGIPETRILIATDVLSEGLNLQDATRLINYDLHWNPVRLMQRIGRVDRRLDPEVEARIIEDHPSQQEVRGTVAYWNFLPPDELDSLLRLYALVSHKVLKISKTFGIEGKRLLTPEDDYDALRDFIKEYEGEETTREKLHLEFQRMLKDHPELAATLDNLPLRVFSGKQHPAKGARGVFFCYSLPALDAEYPNASSAGKEAWTEEAGRAQWFYYDLDHDQIATDPAEIASIIRSTPDTPRHTTLDADTLRAIRKKVEKRIDRDYFRRMNAPVGVKATLKAWMEVS